MIAAILFDLDGTLLDRDATVRGFFERQWARAPNLPDVVSRSDYVTRAIALDQNGYADRSQVYVTLEAALSLPAGLGAHLVDDFEQCFPDRCVVFPGVPQVLLELRDAGTRLGVVTNGSSDRQRRKLQMMNIEPWLDLITISEEVGSRKPDREIFLGALEHLNVDPAQALFIGDNPVVDVEGATRAGLRAIWMRNAWWPPPASADAVIDSLMEIPAIAAGW